MSDAPKKPLPFSAQVPAELPLTDIPPEVQQALFTLIAHCVNHRSEMQTFNVPDAKAGGLDLGSWKITCAQVG